MSLLSVLRTDMNLPRRLQHLTFGFNFNQRLANLNLPSTLESLTLGFHYNQSLEDVTLPSGLESLTFGQSFNQSLDRVTWQRPKDLLQMLVASCRFFEASQMKHLYYWSTFHCPNWCRHVYRPLAWTLMSNVLYCKSCGMLRNSRFHPSV